MFGFKLVRGGNMPPAGLGFPPKPKRAPTTRWCARTTWRVSRWLVRHGVRHRMILAPVYALCLAAIFGVAARTALAAAFFVTTLWLFLGGVLGVWMWRRGNERLDRVGRLLTWAGYATLAALIAGYATLGAVVPMRVATLAWLGGFGGYWWYQMHKPQPPEEVAAPASVDERMKVWEEHVAGQGGIAHRAELFELSPLATDGSWNAKIRTMGGKLTTRSLMAVQDNIGAVFGATEGCCVIEPTAIGRLDQARLQLLSPSNPAHDITDFDWSWVVEEDGCVPLTTFPDATRGWMRIYLPLSGTVNEIHSGDTGSGKSFTLNAAITQSVFTGKVIPFVGDYPKNGTSFPAWGGANGKARWRATSLPEMRRQARALRRLVHDRYRRMSRLKWTDEHGTEHVGIGFYDPAFVPWPIYEATWDEAQNPFKDPEIGEIMEEIMTLVRACGVRFRVAAPYPTADELGGSPVVKQALNAGNTLALRNSIKYAKGMTLPEWMPNPADIPLMVASGPSKGMAVLHSVAPNSQRPVFSRVVRIEKSDAPKWAALAAERIPEEDPDDLAALGDVYATWRVRAERGEDTEEEVKPTVVDLGPAKKPVAATGGAEVAQAAPTLTVVKRYGGSVAEQIKAFLADHEQATSGTIAAGIDRPLGSVSRECSRLLEEGVLAGGRYSAYRLANREREGAAA